MKVGTKALKNKLSHYLRKVRAGETITVTDRGLPVAELRAVKSAETGEHAHLKTLADDGAVQLGEGRFSRCTPQKLEGATLSDAILEDRR